MQFKNTPFAYGAVTKTFHWAMALAIVAMLAVGFFMDDVEDLTAKLQLYGLHKSVGVTVLALAVLRILWHIWSKKPPYVESLKPWEKAAAHFLHLCLYGAMIGMPLSGWLMSSAAGRSVSFFGLFTLPDLIAPDDGLRNIFGTIHFYMAWALVAAIVVHLSAALKHHFVDKDITLRRMLPFCLMLLIAAPAHAAAPKWNVVAEESTLIFAGKVMGKDFSGDFKKFTPEIYFDAADLTQSKITVYVDIMSLDSKDAERDSTAKSKNFLDAETFPAARFETTTIRHMGDDKYEADGNLTLRDVTLPVSLPFTLIFPKGPGTQPRAVAEGGMTLDRSQFKLGSGEWADPGVIANNIEVRFKIMALKAIP